jgi:class 3 adenylate cyclase
MAAAGQPAAASVDLSTDAGSVEHRGVTVLMADLVSSTMRMEALGPEGYALLLRRFHAVCTDAVRAHGGVIAQYQGDGIICYFGFPVAAEDDACRAVEAALDIAGAFATGRDGHSIETRLGLSSGTVMLRADGDQFGASAVGACINRAARLEAMAEPNTVLICEDTMRLVGRVFQLRDLGEHTLSGFSKPQRVHQALRTRGGLTTRFEALRGHRSGLLIGRAAELERLGALFRSARTEGGRSVILAAGPGLGKSRLVSAFLQGEAAAGVPSFVLQCAPEHEGTTLYPVRRYLEWLAGTAGGDDRAARHAKLKRLITQVWGADPAETDILLDLLSPLGSERPMDASESIPLRRGRALTLLAKKLFASVAGSGGFLVVIEDVHWIDPTSAQFVDMLIDRVGPHPGLIVLTTRPEPPFGNGWPETTLMTLTPLDEGEARALALQALGDAAGADEGEIDELIRKSEGVPLFLLEYAEMLRTAEPRAPGAIRIPLSLGGMVQAKLDRLTPAERTFARVGSALGRSFDPALVGHIVEQDEVAAKAATEALFMQRLAHPSVGTQGSDSVTFSHALIRDAIYGNMTSDRRRLVHQSIVEGVLSLGRGTEDHFLASHLARAGRPAEAVPHFLSAAMAAAGKGAAGEALAHLDAGLACLADLPIDTDRDRLELQLLAVRGPTLMVTQGPGSDAFGACQARAMELVELLHQEVQMIPVIFYTAEHAWAVADLDRAERLADTVIEIDRRVPSDAAHMAGNMLQGMVAFHRGDNVRTVESLGRVIARHDADRHGALYAHFIKEFGVFSHFYRGLARTVQGDFEEGRALAEGAVAVAEYLKFPHERGFALLARFNTALLQGDVDTVASASAEARDFSIEQGFPEFVAMATFAHGWSVARRGDLAGGIAQMEEGFAAWRQTGFTCWQAFFAAVLAPFHVAQRSVDTAEALVNEYLSLIDATGEEQFRAPLLLARAIVERTCGEMAAAAVSAAEARRVAVAQGAVLWRQWVDAAFPAETRAPA